MTLKAKIASFNLELGLPTVGIAVQGPKNELTNYKRQGYKAVIVIHGYGSSGNGGSIKTGVLNCLAERSMCGIVRTFACGDKWHEKTRELCGMCNGLADCDGEIAGNPGVTEVILRK